MLLAGLMLVWLIIAIVALLIGIEYYATPVPLRPYTEGHETLKPTGVVGLGYGYIGTFMMLIGVALYSFRKRVRWAANLGKLKHWLTVHIFLCTLGPFLVVLHSTFKLGGLISIGFWSMVVVVASGFFGRYVYTRIPKAINGQFLALRSIKERQEKLLNAIASRCGLAPRDVAYIVQRARRRAPTGFASAVLSSLWFDLTKRRHGKVIQRLLAARRVPATTRAMAVAVFQEQAVLEQQIALRTPFLRLFRLWHLFHIPLSLVMLLVVLIHIVEAVLFGHTWIF